LSAKVTGILRRFLKLDEIEVGNKNSSVYYGNNLILCKTIYGQKMFLDATDYSLTPHLALDGFWERWITNVFLDNVKEGMNVVDIGANVGYYTLLAASKVGKRGRVFAFEPHLETFQILSRNIEINGFIDSVTPINKAVFSKTAKLALHIPQHHKADSSVVADLSHFLKHWTQRGERTEATDVDGISLDDYFADKDIKIDLMKMDAEGSEPHIFDGATKLLRRNPNMAIISEFAPSQITGAGKDPRSFLVQLEDLGFPLKIINFDSQTVQACIDDLLRESFSTLYLKR